MTQTVAPALVSRILSNAAGTPYASYQILVREQASGQPVRLYGDASGNLSINDFGRTSTDATGLASFYAPKGKNLQIDILGPDQSIVDTVYDVSPGDNADLGKALLTLTAGRITSAQATIGANTDIILNDGAGTLLLNTTTGKITLKGGRTYRLTARLGFSTFSNATGGSVTYEWVKDTDNSALVANRAGLSIPPSNTAQVAGNGGTDVIYSPTADTVVKLRCTAAAGTASLDVGTSSVIVTGS